MQESFLASNGSVVKQPTKKSISFWCICGGFSFLAFVCITLGLCFGFISLPFDNNDNNPNNPIEANKPAIVNPNIDIVNGKRVNANDYPWIAALVQYLPSLDVINSMCTASLINLDPITILTAAHCFDGFFFNKTNEEQKYFVDSMDRINYLHVALQRTDAKETNEMGSIQINITSNSQIYVHENYTGDATDGFDIALVIFRNHSGVLPSNYSTLDIIGPFSSPYDQCCSVGEQLIVLGYGINGTDANDPNDLLERTELKYFNKTKCLFSVLDRQAMAHPPAAEVDAWLKTGFFCAIGNNTDVCSGDSGGPLMKYNSVTKKYLQVGISSFVLFGCNSDISSAFVSIGQYYDWIVSKGGLTNNPTIQPTVNPTTQPSINPTVNPTMNPSINPSINPTIEPTINPTNNPTIASLIPTINPTTNPVINPSINPTINPVTINPTSNPVHVPTMHPTGNPTIESKAENWFQISLFTIYFVGIFTVLFA